MTPFLTIVFLWVGGALLAAGVLWVDVRAGRWPRSVLVAAPAVGLLTFAIIYPYEGQYFHGLEYEDAYEYATAGAMLARDPTLEGFLNPICLIANRDACEAIGTLSHPIGLSGLLALLYGFVGDHLYTANLLSMLFFTATVSCLYLVAWLVAPSHWYCLACSLAWTLAPSLFVMAGTSFAEPASAFVLAVALFLVLSWNLRARAGARASGYDTFRLLGLGIMLLLAVLVKRENLAFAGTLPLLALLDRGDRATGRTRASSVVVRFGLLGIVSAWVLGCAWVALGSSLTHVAEYVHPDTSAFAVGNAVKLMGSFAETAASWTKYGLTCIFFVPGMMLGWRTPAHTFVKITVGGYVLLFLTFAHSYYFVEIGEIPTLHFERYALEISPFVSLVTGWGIVRMHGWLAKFPERWAKPLQTLGGLATCVLAAFCIGRGMESRREWVEDEWRSRIRPSREVCAALPEGSTLISSEPLVYDLYCPQQLRIVHYQALGRELSSDALDALVAHGDVFYIARFESMPASENRWSLQRSTVLARLGQRMELPEGCDGVLYRLKPHDTVPVVPAGGHLGSVGTSWTRQRMETPA